MHEALRLLSGWAKTAAGSIHDKPVLSIGGLREVLKPGDILVSSPKPPHHKSGLAKHVMSRVVATGLKAFQRSGFTHSMTYAGDDTVLDLRMRGEGPRVRSLRSAVSGMDVVAVRPLVPEAAREQAAETIRDMIHDVEFKTTNLMKPALGDIIRFKETNTPIAEEVCSTLISKAYEPSIVPHKARESVQPADYIRSPRTEILGVYRHGG